MYIIRNLLRYIINAKHCISSSRREIQPQRGWWDTAPQGLMICTARCAAMIYQACGLNKKIRQVETCRIFWQGRKDSILGELRLRSFAGRTRHLEEFAYTAPTSSPSYSPPDKEKKPFAFCDGFFSLAGAEGLEPTTHGFGDQYSTNWATPLCTKGIIPDLCLFVNRICEIILRCRILLFSVALK